MSNKVVKSGIWYTVSNFILKSFGFITTPIFARMLTKSEYGDYSNFITWQGIVIIICSFSLYASINRARLDYEDDLDSYLSSILTLGALITGICYIIVDLNIVFFESFFSMSAFYIRCMFLYMFFEPAFEIFQIKQRVTYKYKTSVFLSFAQTILTTLVSVILVIYMEDHFYARVIGFVVPCTIINLVIFAYILIKGHSINLSYWRYAILYCWPFVPHLLSTMLLSSSDRVMIKNYCGSEYTAIYTLACTVATIASVLWSSINNATSPWIFDKLKEKNYVALKKITVPYLLVFVLPIQMVLILSPELIWILGGKGYAQATNMVVPLITSVVCQFVYSLYVNVEQYSKKTWCIALGTAIAAGINIGLNLLLMPKWGYEVAAYTTLIGYIVLFVVHYFFVRVIGYKDIYDDKFVFIVIVVSLAIQPFYIWIYNFTFIRYIMFVVEIIVLIAFIIKKRDTILSLINKKG